MIRPSFLALALVACTALGGCYRASMADVLQEKSVGKGVSQVYPTSADQAWSIAVQIFRWDGAGTIEEHRDQNLMLTTAQRASLWQTYNSLASRSSTNVSYEAYQEVTYIGVWAEPVAAGSTKVTYVVSRRATEAQRAETEHALQQRFAQALAILKAGNPLPLEAPPFVGEEPPLLSCESDAECEAGLICYERACRR